MAPVKEEIQFKNPKGAVTTDPAQGHITSYFRYITAYFECKTLLDTADCSNSL